MSIQKLSAAAVLALGAFSVCGSAVAETISFDGTTIGAPTYKSPFADPRYNHFGSNIGYSAKAFTAENTGTYSFTSTTYGYLGLLSLYSSFDPNNSRANLIDWQTAPGPGSSFVANLIAGQSYTFVNSALYDDAAGYFQTTIDYSVYIPPIPSSAPEPGTYIMLLAGLGLMGFVAQRRKQA